MREQSAFPHVAPSLAAFEALAGAVLAGLPQPFRDACAGLVIRVEDFAEQDVLEEMGIDDPYELTGLYDGVALTERSESSPPQRPDIVWLYRRPIFEEWIDRGDVALDALVAHVLVHEIAHHFGWTDDDIRAVDDWTA